MFARTFTAAAALAAAVAVSAAIRRYRALHRTLDRERVAHRLMDGRLHCDMQVFQTRIDQLIAQQRSTHAVLGEADLVLDQALATHRTQPDQEGGPR